MRNVLVQTEKPYQVKIECGLLKRVGEELLLVLGTPCTVAVLTDDIVDAIYGIEIQASLEASGFHVCRFAVPHGETHKDIQTWQTMLDFLAAEHVTRSDCVLALGGGVVGDMAGFAAASFLRGVRFVQIPTTLLAMVDSSVGGKTGVNLTAGKNLVGAFHQPDVVLCDPEALATLPDDTLADGVAEAIKYGVLGDMTLFDLLSSGDWREQIAEVIQRCVAAKAALVVADTNDTGSRQLLNLGHTLGHAIERCSGYEISHGHAVGIGMVYATRLAVKLGLCDKTEFARIVTALETNALPTSAEYSAEALCEVALRDKKRMGDKLTFILPREIGRCELYPVAVSELIALVRKSVAKEG